MILINSGLEVSMRPKWLFTLFGFAVLIAFVPIQAACEDKKKAGNVYADHIQCEGKDCKVDIFMVRGFRAFSQCQVCHGLDANGSSFAPSLNEKLKEIDRARFDEVVTNGYTGQIGVMPGWKDNPNVMKKIDNLYAYLKARSDGAIPPGRLERYDR